jgi:hypothetical protein
MLYAAVFMIGALCGVGVMCLMFIAKENNPR